MAASRWRRVTYYYVVTALSVAAVIAGLGVHKRIALDERREWDRAESDERLWREEESRLAAIAPVAAAPRGACAVTCDRHAFFTGPGPARPADRAPPAIAAGIAPCDSPACHGGRWTTRLTPRTSPPVSEGPWPNYSGARCKSAHGAQTNASAFFGTHPHDGALVWEGGGGIGGLRGAADIITLLAGSALGARPGGARLLFVGDSVTVQLFNVLACAARAGGGGRPRRVRVGTPRQSTWLGAALRSLWRGSGDDRLVSIVNATDLKPVYFCYGPDTNDTAAAPPPGALARMFHRVRRDTLNRCCCRCPMRLRQRPFLLRSEFTLRFEDPRRPPGTAATLRRVTVDVVHAYSFRESAATAVAWRKHNVCAPARILDVDSLFAFAERSDAHVLLLQTANTHFVNGTNPEHVAAVRAASGLMARRAAAWQARRPARRAAMLVEALPQHFCWSGSGDYVPPERRGACLAPGWTERCAPLQNARAARWRAEAAAAAAAASGLGHLRLFDAFEPMWRAHSRKAEKVVDCTHWVPSANLFQPFFSRLFAHLAHRYGDVVD